MSYCAILSHNTLFTNMCNNIYIKNPNWVCTHSAILDCIVPVLKKENGDCAMHVRAQSDIAHERYMYYLLSGKSNLVKYIMIQHSLYHWLCIYINLKNINIECSFMIKQRLLYHWLCMYIMLMNITMECAFVCYTCFENFAFALYLGQCNWLDCCVWNKFW